MPPIMRQVVRDGTVVETTSESSDAVDVSDGVGDSCTSGFTPMAFPARAVVLADHQRRDSDVVVSPRGQDVGAARVVRDHAARWRRPPGHSRPSPRSCITAVDEHDLPLTVVRRAPHSRRPLGTARRLADHDVACSPPAHVDQIGAGGLILARNREADHDLDSPRRYQRYICIRGLLPSAGVAKLALFSPRPSCASAFTESLPSPAAEVVLLEISGRLGEAVAVEDVVHPVVGIEEGLNRDLSVAGSTATR